MSEWPRYAEMTWLRLLEGPGHLVVIEVAPTMQRLIWRGQKYDRQPDSRAALDPADGIPPYMSALGGAYLWSGWWPARVAQVARERSIGGRPVEDIRPVGEVVMI